jgi:predicted metal-dependent phosphoesterase TrpH
MTVRLAPHVHSTWSYDGRYSLDEIARLFGRLGYDGVLMSEHDRGWDTARWLDYGRACEAASTAEVTLVPGLEYSDPDNVVHVLVWGCAEFLGAGLPTQTLLARLSEQTSVAVLAHPGRGLAARRLTTGLLRRFDGIEVWSRKYDGVRPNERAAALAAGLGAAPFVGLDFHTRRQLFPLSLALEVDDTLPRPEAIAAALRERTATPLAFGAPLPRVLSPPALALLGGSERLRRVGASARRKLVSARR